MPHQGVTYPRVVRLCGFPEHVSEDSAEQISLSAASTINVDRQACRAIMYIQHRTMHRLEGVKSIDPENDCMPGKPKSSASDTNTLPCGNTKL